MDKLLLGIKGHAVCINKMTGEKIWSTKLKSASGVTNIFVEQESVFAYSGGHLFCLDLMTGNIKWENKLEGMGYGTCIMASATQNPSVIASHMAMQQASAASATAVASSGVHGGEN